MTTVTSNARGEWVLVPREPTPEMLAATSWPGCAASDYAHMLAAAPQPPSAPVGVGAPGSRAWMAEVCRAAALSLAAHGVRNDQLSKVADWITQQPAAVDGALDRMRHAPPRLWRADLVGQQISVERMRDILSFALAAQHQEPSDG